MNDESSKYQAVEGTIVNTLSNSRSGFHLEIEADMGFCMGDRVWISRSAPGSQPAEQPKNGVVAFRIVGRYGPYPWVDISVLADGEEIETIPGDGERVEYAYGQPKAATGDEKFRTFEISHEPRTSTADQAVATAGDGVTERVEAGIAAAVRYTKDNGYEHFTTGAIDAAVRAALASPSAPRVGVPEGWKVERGPDVLGQPSMRITSPDGEEGLYGIFQGERFVRDFLMAAFPLAAEPEVPK